MVVAVGVAALEDETEDDITFEVEEPTEEDEIEVENEI